MVIGKTIILMVTYIIKEPMQMVTDMVIGNTIGIMVTYIIKETMQMVKNMVIGKNGIKIKLIIIYEK